MKNLEADKLRIYLDNCCYNRPYDDQTQLKISLETQAKLYIQDCIKENKFQLAASYVLIFENAKNPYQGKKESILKFLEENTDIFIDESYKNEVGNLAEKIMATGIKTADAHHIAAAILAKCDFLITTDKRMLKFVSEKIKIVSPIDFIDLAGEKL